MARSPRRWLLAAFAVLTTLIAGAVGLLFGGLAALAHMVVVRAPPQSQEGQSVFDRLLWTGFIIGAAAGLASGLAWSRIMVRRARREPWAGLIRPGAGLGAGLGAGSTAVLHAFLIAIREAYHPKIELLGPSIAFAIFSVVAFGLTAGAAVGACCGWALGVIRKKLLS